MCCCCFFFVSLLFSVWYLKLLKLRKLKSKKEALKEHKCSTKKIFIALISVFWSALSPSFSPYSTETRFAYDTCDSCKCVRCLLSLVCMNFVYMWNFQLSTLIRTMNEWYFYSQFSSLFSFRLIKWKREIGIAC